MRLELGTFPVKEVIIGSRTTFEDGVLELGHDELLAPVLEDSSISGAKLEVAKPGESARIINYLDIVDPRVKVKGRGVAYPGRCGRPVDTVGEGRTHKLGNTTVTVCVDGEDERVSEGWVPRVRDPGVPRPLRSEGWASTQRFVDMSGSGAILPYASMFNVCLTLGLKGGLERGNAAHVIYSNMLRLSDKLAETTVGSEPTEVEVFDLTKKDASLPGVVFICLLASYEHSVGPRSAHGWATYGATRLSAPWVLGPTEMLDGAVMGVYADATWPLTNNPIVVDLCRRHGKSVNFLGCIQVRTNWGSEDEMQLSSNRAAEAARLLGAQGAIITNHNRGRRFVDSMHTVQKCERLGIRTVYMSEEEDNEEGNAPAFISHPPEMTAVVSVGNGGTGPFDAVERVIGWVEAVDPAWQGELPPVPGRYSAGHIADHYGSGRQSCIDY